MGQKFAPVDGNIYMAHWEETVFQKSPKLPTNYFRYLDDIWGTWTYSLEQFKHFMVCVNDLYRGITVKYTTHNTHIDLLDTTMYKGPSFPQTFFFVEDHDFVFFSDLLSVPRSDRIALGMTGSAVTPVLWVTAEPGHLHRVII